MDAQERGWVEVDGCRLEYVRWPGACPAILLLHEALGSVSIWRDFPARLAKATGRAVVAWSRSGHGNSDDCARPRDKTYFDDEAAVTLALMDTLSIDCAVLHGHSDGTAIALLVAALAPERVEKLILEAPHVCVEDGALRGIGKARQAFLRGPLRGRLERHHRDADAVFARWCDHWLAPSFRDWTIEPRLGAVRAPVLLVQGKDDGYFSMDQLDRIEATVSSPTVRCELADCGHSPYREKPEAVLHAVTSFLAADTRA